MARISGKALLVIGREDISGSYGDFYVHPYVLTATGGRHAAESAQDDLSVFPYAGEFLPFMARMEEGDVVRAAVKYTIHYYQDYQGEWDMDIEIRSYRVLRRQRARPRYVAKSKRAAHDLSS